MVYTAHGNMDSLQVHCAKIHKQTPFNQNLNVWAEHVYLEDHVWAHKHTQTHTDLCITPGTIMFSD